MTARLYTMSRLHSVRLQITLKTRRLTDAGLALGQPGYDHPGVRELRVVKHLGRLPIVRLAAPTGSGIDFKWHRHPGHRCRRIRPRCAAQVGTAAVRELAFWRSCRRPLLAARRRKKQSHSGLGGWREPEVAVLTELGRSVPNAQALPSAAMFATALTHRPLARTVATLGACLSCAHFPEIA